MEEPTYQPIDHTTSRRRFLESYDPLKGRRLFMKRSSTREEATKDLNPAGTPRNRTERSFSSLENEAKAIHFVKTHTSIPVPTIVTVFEDRGCLYMIQEYIENAISALDADKRLHPHIIRQLEHYMSQLHNLRSHKLHSFSLDLQLPARLVSTEAYLSQLSYPEDPQCRYVLCHGDLGWQNILVDPITGDIKSIIDWEYAGFYPVEVEGQYWKRCGTACPIGSERGDIDIICQLLVGLNDKRQFKAQYQLAPKIDYTTQIDSRHRKMKTTQRMRRSRKSHLGPADKLRRLLGLSIKRSAMTTHHKAETAEIQSANFQEQDQDQGKAIIRDLCPVGVAAASVECQGPLSKPNLNIDASDQGQSRRPQEILDAPEWHDLELKFAEDRTITQQVLTVQVAIASRDNICQHIDYMRRRIDIDHRTGQDWTLATSRDAPGYYHEPLKSRTLVRETLHLQELCRPLSEAISQLVNHLRLSIDPLKRFQRRQILAQELTEKLMIERDQLSTQPEDPRRDSMVLFEAEADEVRRRIHSDRDQAFRESETLKWDAIRKCAQTLLVISHAAHTLLPFAPDRVRNQPSRAQSSSRKEAEDRVRDLLLGGQGGWEAQVVNLEDWVPIDVRERGVPEDDEEQDEEQDERDNEDGKEPLTERILKYHYESDAKYLAILYERGSAGDSNVNVT